MILRHIADKLRRHDWGSVAIELMVVMIGVFIGVQASNWNDEREQNRRGGVFSERLRQDLKEEAWGYEMQIGYYSDVAADARRAADALSGKRPLSDADLLVAAYRATQYNGNIRRRATYDELTSTGEIGLIHDMALRDLAMRVYTAPLFDDIDNEGRGSEYRHWFRLNLPHDVQQRLSDACGDKRVRVGHYEDIDATIDYDCSPGLAPDPLASAAALLRNDPAVLPLLRLRLADVDTNLANLVTYNKDLRDGLARLAGRPIPR